jgi:cell division transport system permease protein
MEQAEAGAAVLRAMPGVIAVRLVPQTEVDALIEPWLGAGRDDTGAVPVPALIDAQLDGAITPARLAELTQQVHRVAPAARIDAQAGWLKPVFGAIGSLQWLAAALIVLLAGAMAAAVLLAARTALDNHRATIEIVHMLGGTDAQIARIVQRAIAVDAAVGGAIGLGLAVSVILFLGARFASLDAGLVQGGALGLADWSLLALIPVAGVALALLTARLSVLRALRRML